MTKMFRCDLQNVLHDFSHYKKIFDPFNNMAWEVKNVIPFIPENTEKEINRNGIVVCGNGKNRIKQDFLLFCSWVKNEFTL